MADKVFSWPLIFFKAFVSRIDNSSSNNSLVCFDNLSINRQPTLSMVGPGGTAPPQCRLGKSSANPNADEALMTALMDYSEFITN